MKNFSRFVFCAAVAVAMLGMTFTQSLAYGPITFEGGDNGGPYYKYGPDAGEVLVSFPDTTLLLDPTVNGAGLVYDTGFATTLSSYTVSADCQWSTNDRSRASILGYAIPGLGSIGYYQYITSSYEYSYVLSLFDETNPLGNSNPEHVEDWMSGCCSKIPEWTAAQQVSGDGTSTLDFGNLHNISLEITDTGDNSTSTFKCTWTQEVGGYTNVWEAEETFANIRSCAIGEAVEKELGTAIENHIGDLFDTLVNTARSDTGTTGFCYLSFAATTTFDWDNTTVVPEPSTMVLLASLLLGLLIWRKK